MRTGRTADKGAFTFLELNDGSCVHSIQVLVKAEVKNPDEIKSTGVCVVVQGEIKASPEGAKQKIELHATSVLHVGACEAKTYPMGKLEMHVLVEPGCRSTAESLHAMLLRSLSSDF